MAKTSDVSVEFATTDGLVRYVISNGDLSAVPAEHQAQVRSALGSEPVEAPPIEDTATPEAGDTPDTTPARGKKE